MTASPCPLLVERAGGQRGREGISRESESTGARDGREVKGDDGRKVGVREEGRELGMEVQKRRKERMTAMRGDNAIYG